MNYFSFEFSIILLLFLILYWSFKRLHHLQNVTLLLFNYFLLFSFFNHWYFALIVCLYSLAVYVCSLLLHYHKQLFLLLFCVLLCIMNLVFFKYFPQFKEGFDNLIAFMGMPLNIDFIFPLGLSFYTFASITYLVAVYRDGERATFIELATYLSFFPTIVAGPIMRSTDFLAQFRKIRVFRYGNDIIILILTAIIKKALIANYLSIWTQPIFENPAQYDSITLICAAYVYSIQLYCDFSGYVDLVTAFGLMLGFKLPKNFDMPFTSRNIQEFWKKWHMSLSYFIRDYIYIPLGGSKAGSAVYINIMIAFIISGVWHVNTQDGSNTLNFVLWGSLHGMGVCFIHFLRIHNIALGIPSCIASFITFSFVSLCWIFFFLPSFEDSIAYIALIGNNFSLVHYEDFLPPLIVIVVFFLYPFTQYIPEITKEAFSILPLYLKPIMLTFALMLIFIIMPDGIPNFIYSRF